MARCGFGWFKRGYLDGLVFIWRTPTVVNPPPGGWLQNANEAPYVNTLPSVLKVNDFAPHITEPMNGMFLKPHRSARLLHENDSIGFDGLVPLKHDTKAEFALRIQDNLLNLKEHTSDLLVLEAIVYWGFVVCQIYNSTLLVNFFGNFPFVIPKWSTKSYLILDIFILLTLRSK